MPTFEHDAKALGRLMYDQVVKLCTHIDKFAKNKVTNYQENCMYDSELVIPTHPLELN